MAGHKVRSFLTVLGILIGVSSIIAIMSIGKGLTHLVKAEIEQLGADMVFAAPGRMESGFADFLFVDLFNEKDLEALRNPLNVPNLLEIMPAVIVPGRISHGSSVYRGAMIMGGDADFISSAYSLSIRSGFNFSDYDIRDESRVVVIGSQVEEKLFGDGMALNQTVLIKNARFRVVGVYESRGQVGPMNVDDIVIVPYTTAQVYLLGNNEFQEFYIRADDSANVNRMAHDIRMTLRETRNIAPGEDDDFTVMTQQGLLDQIGTIMNILTAFLVFVVAISLVVGGIGIMNIMLVSVTERTKEIGLRKALGATGGDILRQFLWEAVVLTVIGGFLGILVGALISYSVSVMLSNTLAYEWPFYLSFGAIFLGLGMSAVVGLTFGIYPAREASKKDPIEALKNE